MQKQHSTRAPEGPCYMPAQPASPPVFQVALWREIFIKWFLRQHQLFKRLPGPRRGQCMQGILRPERVEFVPQRRWRRPPRHAFFCRCLISPKKGAEEFCVQRGAFAASEKLSIQPIVCFQIHFEFLSPKLERKKLQIEFLPCPAPSPPPLPPYSGVLQKLCV